MLQVIYEFVYRCVVDLDEQATVGFVADTAAEIEDTLRRGPGIPVLRSVTVKETE